MGKRIFIKENKTSVNDLPHNHCRKWNIQKKRNDRNEVKNEWGQERRRKENVERKRTYRVSKYYIIYFIPRILSRNIKQTKIKSIKLTESSTRIIVIIWIRYTDCDFVLFRSLPWPLLTRSLTLTRIPNAHVQLCTPIIKTNRGSLGR